MWKRLGILMAIVAVQGMLLTMAEAVGGQTYPYELFKNRPYASQIKSVLPRGTRLNKVRDYFSVSDGMHHEGRFWFGSGCVPHSCSISEGFMVFEQQGGKPYLIIMDTPDPMNQARRQFVSYGARLTIQGNRARLDRPYPAALRNWFSELNVILE